MNDLQAEMNARLRAKADVYRLLSACYYEPEDAFLQEDVFGQIQSALSVLSGDLAEAAASLAASYREAGQEALMLDHTGLFLGPFNVRAKPYGSVYLDGENVVMGNSTMAVLALYRDAGFHVDDAFREMPDHVALELEFLYLLNARLAQEERTDERQRLTGLKDTFLRVHLGQWIVPFAEAVERGADTEFYKGLAALTRRFVHWDYHG